MEVLTVYTDLENNTQWKLCFESANVKLPTGYYLGASASTGNPSNIHDIISIKFYELQPLASVSSCYIYAILTRDTLIHE